MVYIPNSAKPAITWDINKRIFIKENCISTEMCDEIIKQSDPQVQRGISKYPGVFEVSFDACLLPLEHEVHSHLNEVWNELSDFFKIDIDFVEPYEYKRYTTEDFFGKHVDNYYSLTTSLDRKITMSIQLSSSDEFEGGELDVLGKKIKSSKGSIVCFPSFFPHAVSKITSGIRRSLIGWAWGPYWK